jgi:Mg-chelatase subunit ChlD/uncharacterized membrane protein
VTLLQPWGLLGLLAALPILAVHMLRPRRPPVEVSSTLLWREAGEAATASRPWQRPRRELSLFLQLLAVVLLAAALARPARVEALPLRAHTIFLVDASGSMAALDGDPDRLADAHTRVLELVDGLPEGGAASVVELSHEPRVLVRHSNDRSEVEAALASMRATASAPDAATASALAASLVRAGEPASVVVVSDGGLTQDEQALLPAGARHERVGAAATNRAVERVSVVPTAAGLQVRVTVANTGGGTATQLLRVDVDGVTAGHVELDVPSGETVEHTFDVPIGAQVVALLEGEDLLGADNIGYAVGAGEVTLRVRVEGAPSVFLDELLGSLPGIDVEYASEAGPIDPADPPDVIVYDGVPVPEAPAAPFLAIAPPDGVPGDGGVTVVGEVERPVPTLLRSEDPLLAGLDLGDLAIARAQRVLTDGDVLVGAESAPLLVRGAGTVPWVYVAFALPDSDLPVDVAFPILGSRVLRTLAGVETAAPDVHVGDRLPVTPGAAATVRGPLDTHVVVAPSDPAPVADRPGFWTVSEEGRPPELVAVNASPRESALAPADLAAPRAAASADGTPPDAAVRHHGLVIPLLVLAALVLAAEWLVTRRRIAVPRGQRRIGAVARLAGVALLAAALLGPSIARPSDDVAVVFVLDASDSLGADGRAAAEAFVVDALAERGDDRAAVVVVGGEARVAAAMADDTGATALDAPAAVDASSTDLALGVRLARSLLPDDARPRIVVVSDGRATTGDLATEADGLAEAGIDLDVHVVEPAHAGDVAVTGVDVPDGVREGEEFEIHATVVAADPGPATVTLRRDGAAVATREVELVVGENDVAFRDEATAPGVSRYEVEVDAVADTVAQNDVRHAAVAVEGTPHVLLVEGVDGNGAALAAALEARSIDTEVVGMATIPPRDELATASSIVLVDVDERSLATEQLEAIDAAVRTLGRGLVVIGGDQSYALGGYRSSPLEDLLPVISEIDDPERREPVSEVLAIDVSESMGACHCSDGGMVVGGGEVRGGIVLDDDDGGAVVLGPGGMEQGGVNKTDISRAAAARAIEALEASDEVGVLAFNGEQHWIVPMQQLPSEEVVREGLDRLRPQGSTDIGAALTAAAEELRSAQHALRHIILFTDGFSSQLFESGFSSDGSFGSDALSGLAEQAAALAAEGITVSVVATGETPALEALRSVAEAGNGRFYPGRDLSEIPEIFVDEARLVSRDFVNEGEFYPAVTSTDHLVRELTAAPPLFGFVATTPKPTAEVLLAIGDHADPLLATWRVGLGRATAWTSDASERWSQQWATWDGYADFWSALVRDTFPVGGAEGSAVRAEVSGGTLAIAAEGEEPWPDGATARAEVARPDGTVESVELERVDETTFRGTLPAEGVGTYATGITVTGADGVEVLHSSSLASQSFGAEYLPGGADRDGLLAASERAGGRGDIAAEAAFDASSLADRDRDVSLRGWLVLAALALWPLDVAVRRVVPMWRRRRGTGAPRGPRRRPAAGPRPRRTRPTAA